MSRNATPPNLKSAMMTIENDVELPSRVRAHSAVGNLIALDHGEVFTLSMEIPKNTTLGSLQEDANALKSKIRNSMNASIRNAKQHTGNTYSMESALVTYPSGRTFIQIVVTCTLNEPGDYEDDDAAEDDDDEI